MTGIQPLRIAAIVVATGAALAACSPEMMRGGGGRDEATLSGGTRTSAPLGSSAAAGLAQPDGDMARVLAAHAALGAKPIETLSVDEARRQPTLGAAAAEVARLEGRTITPVAMARVRDINIASPAGPLPARVYVPTGARGPLPVVLYFHGGGWVLADLDAYDASARAIADEAKAIVISSHYRQAPEHKFPAAHEDAFAAWTWTVRNARRLGGDPELIAVAGESAGGNLAANVAIMARDRGVQAPVHQVLIYPVAGSSLNTPSYREHAEAKPLNRAGMAWFGERYLRGAADGADTRIDLVSAPNLAGVAPATIILAQIDPLRSEGETYGQRLAASGVPVTVVGFEGVTHEFFGLGAVVADARLAQQLVGERLREAFDVKRARF